MNNSVKTYAILATVGQRINETNAEIICVITKTPDGYINVFLDNVPESGPGLNKAVDNLKYALEKLQATIQNYEDKIRYNG